MPEPKVNGGISGPLNYDPDLTSTLERLKKEIEKTYPVEIKIQILDLMDKRWKTWKNYNGKEKI